MQQYRVNLKQRLTGAIILVSLGVILIPFLLNGGPDLRQKITGNNIPDMPKQLDRKLPELPAPDAMPAAKVITTYPVGDLGKIEVKPETDKTQSAVPETNNSYTKAKKSASDKVDSAYTLQIASFSKITNAVALRDKLRKARFKAYIESINTENGTMYRLRVGPYLKYDQLNTIQKQLEMQFKLNNTIIVHYKT